jgi:putative restriction endonuclease
MAIGALPGSQSGQAFQSRRELYDADVHKTLQAGVVGSGPRGAESIVLSGGYADDEDHGEIIIYTGHGGRDPATGRQVADQTFTNQNQALVTSSLEGLPIRVVRGSGHRSPFSPGLGTATTVCFASRAIGGSQGETASSSAASAWLQIEPETWWSAP